MKNSPGGKPPDPPFARFAGSSFQPPQYEFRSDGPVIGPFSVIFNHEIFVKLNYLDFQCSLDSMTISRKYLDLLDFNWNANHSYLWSAVGAMNFRK